MLTRKPPPRREATQTTYRPAMEPARAVMRRVDQQPAQSIAAPAPRRESGRATLAEREYMGRVAALGCLLCGQPAEVHHIREGQGMAQRASNWLTVPLCPEHHRGAAGLHGLGERGFERRHRLGELDLLAQTIERMSK